MAARAALTLLSRLWQVILVFEGVSGDGRKIIYQPLPAMRFVLILIYRLGRLVVVRCT